jgi:hypothetical protein
MVSRVSQICSGKVEIKKCLKAHSLKRPADQVSPGTVLDLFTLFVDFTSFNPFGRWLLAGS